MMLGMMMAMRMMMMGMMMRRQMMVWGKDQIVNVEDGSTCEPAFYQRMMDGGDGYKNADEDDSYEDEDCDDG